MASLFNMGGNYSRGPFSSFRNSAHPAAPTHAADPNASAQGMAHGQPFQGGGFTPPAFSKMLGSGSAGGLPWDNAPDGNTTQKMTSSWPRFAQGYPGQGQAPTPWDRMPETRGSERPLTQVPGAAAFEHAQGQPFQGEGFTPPAFAEGFPGHQGQMPTAPAPQTGMPQDPMAQRTALMAAMQARRGGPLG